MIDNKQTSCANAIPRGSSDRNQCRGLGSDPTERTSVGADSGAALGAVGGAAQADFAQFLQAALVAGHEGLMAKALDSTYSVGKRGKKWFKIKPADLLDMVIVAAEWGSGRREGWLSNYWLAVRDEPSGEFQMIGKTFKGLTDAEFETMTERLRGLATSEESWGYHVRPEVVVEVAYNEIQRSPHYPSGFALRFARIVRIRDDKGPGDVDTYAKLRDLYGKQFERKGRGPDDL